ncbi:MAG: FAD-dependent oxidoreductase [Pseudomonadota bacterium]|nr:FAD-dependent oxidoreductase [Pseudomonadota bacterium]
MTRNKLLLIAGLLALIVAYFAFDLGRFLSLDAIRARQGELAALYAARPWAVIAAYFALYLAVTALSLPGAVILTLLGGATFGLLAGTLIVSFASTLGATLAFLASRYVLRETVAKRFGTRLAAVDAGLKKDGPYYLLTLRLVPLVPFFVVNLVMGLTRMKVATFYLVSQIGMLAGTLVYVNAGTELARVESLRGILSPGLLGSFVLLGVFPLLAKKLVDVHAARKVYARWAAARPKKYDRNLIVIGAGAAGLVSSYIAAAVKAEVTLIESGPMGGDCLNYGCVPSKALIRSATLLHQIARSPAYGIAKADASFDFAELMDRVARVIGTIAPHDSVERYTQLGVDVRQGRATIVDPWTVEIVLPGGRSERLTTRAIVVAAGAAPFVPPLPGLAEAGFLTSDTLWSLRELPKRLVVLGGGPIGCELAQCFARLGSEVTQIEMSARLLGREDEDVSTLARAALERDGVRVLTGSRALRCESEGTGSTRRSFIVVEAAGEEQRIEFDRLLCAVGRVARLQGYGLEALGLVDPAKPPKTLPTDAYLQTIFPNIYAAGDVAGPYQFTHTAAHQAWYASVNALFGTFRKFKADYSVIPWATFIDPEVARVGLNEQEAKEQGVAYEVTRYDIAELDRAIADSAAEGWVKVLTVPKKDRILGVTIVGAHAGDLLAEYVLAMKHGLGLNKLLATIHIYPTMAEANKYAAGEWKRNHQPERLLEWARRYHAWRRG